MKYHEPITTMPETSGENDQRNILENEGSFCDDQENGKVLSLALPATFGALCSWGIDQLSARN